MFLRRLLRVDAKQLADDAVVLYVDFGRTGVLENPREYTAHSLREQLYEFYGIDIDAGDFLRGTYHSEVRRFATGLNAELKELDPNEFKRREIDRLQELASHTEDHMRRSLEHLVKLRSQQVIIVLDNIDQRSTADQEEVFLIAISMASSWPCTVFVTLRPETFNASRIRGTLSGYQPRAFTIEPPRVERVIEKRLQYGARYYEQDGRLPHWMGWTAQSDDLRQYLDVLIKSLARNERLQEMLVNLSGGNGRRALELFSDFTRSPHAAADETLKRNEGATDYLVPHHTFLRAVLLGERVYYHPASSRVPNLFDLSTNDPREHFVLPCVLGLLKRDVERQDTEGYVAVPDAIGELQDLGFDPDQIDFALRRASVGEFLESLPPDTEPTQLRLTMVGAYAHQRLPAEFQYVDAVIIDTPICDPAVRQGLRNVHAIRQRLERTEAFIAYLDAVWASAELDSSGLFDWSSCATSVRTEMAYIADRL
jgi:hypothetical protein